MSDGQSTPGWRVTGLWIALGILFALAAFVVLRASTGGEYTHETSIRLAVFFGGVRQPPTQTVRVGLHEDGDSLYFQLVSAAPNADQVVVATTHLAKGQPCSVTTLGRNATLNRIPFNYVRGFGRVLDDWRRENAIQVDLVEIDTRSVARDATVSVGCSLELKPYRIPVAGRRFRLSPLYEQIGPNYHEAALAVDFGEMTTLSDFYLIGGTAVAGTSDPDRQRGLDSEIVATWRDEHDSQVQDVLLLLIGALLGLSGACLIEALRPFVERAWGAGRDR